MAANNISFSGLNSGLDTEGIIQAMMSTYQTRIDNQNKKLTKLQWQQEAYRSVTEKFTNFQSKYFDVLNKENYISGASSFKKFSADITTNAISTNGFSVTTSSSSIAQTYKVKVNQTATATTVSGKAITPNNFTLDFDKAIETAKQTESTSDTGETVRNYDFALDVTVGNTTKTISFSAEAVVGADGSVDTDALKQTMLDNMNAELQDTFGHSGRVGDATLSGVVDENGNEWYLQVEKNADGGYDFRVGGNISVSVTENKGSFGLKEASSRVGITASSAVTGTNTIAVTVGDLTKQVSFEGVSATYYSSKNAEGNEDILAEFNSLKANAFYRTYGTTATEAQLKNFSYTDVQAAQDKNSYALNDALKSAFAGDDVSFTVTDTYISATKDGAAADISMSVVDGGTLGIAHGTASNKIASSTKLSDLGVAASDEGYGFVINGVEVKVDANASVNDLITAVNKSGAGVTMSYSALTNSFTVTANDMGSTGDIKIEGNEFTNMLGLTDESGAMYDYTRGNNAILEINGEEIYLNNNSYKIDGTTFTFNDDVQLGETFTVGVTQNTEDVKTLIKNFVTDYNTLIDEIYDYIGTKPKTDSSDNRYEPLTDTEKEAMSEEEIKTWEETAKIGILYNDSTISSIMSKMRTALYSSHELEDGSKIGLYNIGIKTSDDYAEHGKLEIDEDKLDKMLSENLDDIAALFSDSKNGIMNQIDSIIDSAVKSTGSAENRGTLIKKAGLDTGTSATDNAIYEQMENIRERISNLQDRYKAREDYWWSVFTSLESMMSDLNSQTGYISSYLGTSGTTTS